MSTVNLASRRLELAEAEKQRVLAAELKLMRAETESLRKQMELIAHHVHHLRDCMVKQVGINVAVTEHLKKNELLKKRKTAP